MKGLACRALTGRAHRHRRRHRGGLSGGRVDGGGDGRVGGREGDGEGAVVRLARALAAHDGAGCVAAKPLIQVGDVPAMMARLRA